MTRESRPYFQFFPKDWLPSTRSMSGAARGYHIDMLALAWLNDGCDVDDEAVRRSVGAERSEWRRVWSELEPRWPVIDGRRRNAKLERVREEATAYSEAKRRAGHIGGKASAEAKANAKQTSSSRQANGQAETKPSHAHALTEEKNTPTPHGAGALFARFWEVYPRHTGKANAWKSFSRLKPDTALLDTMLSALAWQKQTDQWQRNIVPHPATWLNGRRWEDERPVNGTHRDEPIRQVDWSNV